VPRAVPQPNYFCQRLITRLGAAGWSISRTTPACSARSRTYPRMTFSLNSYRRMKAIGTTPAGRNVFVVFTWRGERAGSALLRPISARYMHRREAESHEKAYPDLLVRTKTLKTSWRRLICRTTTFLAVRSSGSRCGRRTRRSACGFRRNCWRRCAAKPDARVSPTSVSSEWRSKASIAQRAKAPDDRRRNAALDARLRASRYRPLLTRDAGADFC
jgi:uncharacterized protein